MPKEYRFLVDGNWYQSPEKLVIKNPYNDEPVGVIHRAQENDVNKAIESAHNAFQKMKHLSSHERAQILHNIVNGLKKRTDDIIETMVKESGKPIKFAEGEFHRALNTFTLSAEESTRITGELLPLDVTNISKNRIGIIKRFPLGVIVGITPFNFPLNLVAHKVGPCIASGNTMILRPSSQTPITALKLGEICMEAGLSPGALNVIPCSTTLVEKLLTDDRVKKVSFTGSAEIGWSIKEKAHKKKVTLELGGNAAVIVDKDADIEFAARRTAIGGFAYAGQVCIAVQRIYVHKDIYDHFYKAFEKVVKNEIVTGDPMKEETVVGPVIDDVAAERIMEWVNEAKQNGAKALIDGKRNGRMIEPIVLTDVSPSMKVSCKEIFGPVVTIESYEHFSDAIARVNNSVYGLQCGVFTKNLDYVLKAFNEIEVGGVIINDYPTFRVDNMPYGGVKESGFGREGVRYAIEEMTELKLLVLNFH